MIRWVAVLALLLAGCGASSCSTAMVEVGDSPASIVALEPQVSRVLTVLHARLFGHPRYPDHEWAMCLRVRPDGDTLRVYDVSAANVDTFTTEPDSVAYRRISFTCAQDLGELYGTWHNHPPPPSWDGCAFSELDMAWQDEERIPLMLVSCGDNPVKFIARILDADAPAATTNR